MKRIKSNTFWLSTVFLILLITSCKSQNLRCTFLEKDGLQYSEKLLMLSLYDEPFYPKVILINKDNGEQIYHSDGFIGVDDQMMEFEIDGNVKYLNIIYNNKEFKIKMNKSYRFIYIEFKSKEFLEIVYTNKKPVYT